MYVFGRHLSTRIFWECALVITREASKLWVSHSMCKLWSDPCTAQKCRVYRQQPNIASPYRSSPPSTSRRNTTYGSAQHIKLRLSWGWRIWIKVISLTEPSTPIKYTVIVHSNTNMPVFIDCCASVTMRKLLPCFSKIQPRAGHRCPYMVNSPWSLTTLLRCCMLIEWRHVVTFYCVSISRSVNLGLITTYDCWASLKRAYSWWYLLCHF